MATQQYAQAQFDALAGIPMHNIMEEIIWINAQGIDLVSIAGRKHYITMSRAGRNFAMNRRQRAAICDYVERVSDVTVTNVECRKLEAV